MGEVESYLPEMRTQLRRLAEDTSNRAALTELHRMAHTIRGAASMVGLEKLSSTASFLEDALDGVLAGRQECSATLVTGIGDVVDSVDRYCTGLHDGEDTGEEMYQLARNIFSATDKEQEEEHEDEAAISLEQILFDEEENDEEISEGSLLDSLVSDEDDDLLDDLLLETESAPETESVERAEPERPVPVSAPDAVSSFDQELLEGFNEEAAEHLDTVVSTLNILADTVTSPAPISSELREHLHVVRRGVHTLKGAAAVVGIEPVAAWGHTFEDFLDWLHDEALGISPEIINILFAGHDLLERLVAEPESDIADLQQQIVHDIKGIMEQDPDAFAGGGRDEAPEDLLTVQPEAEEKPETGGGISLSFDQELLESFHEEATEHLETIAATLNELGPMVTAPVPVNDEVREHLHVIRRGVHTLKGAAAVIGIEPVAEWGHEFEDFLDWLHDEAPALSPEVIESLFAGSELLELLVEEPASEISQRRAETVDSFEQIKKTLARIEVQGAVQTGTDTSLPVKDGKGAGAVSSAGKQQVDAALKDSFDAEAEEYLEIIGRQLNLLASIILEPCVIDQELEKRLDALRRAVHGLKGAALVIGFSSVSDWSKAFESFLQQVIESRNRLTPQAVAVMLRAADILEKIKNDPDQDVSAHLEDMRRSYREILDTTQGTDSSSDRKPDAPVAAYLKKMSGTLRRRNTAAAPSRKKMFRVRGDKLDNVIGLSGDLSITLSSFDTLAGSMFTGVSELNMTLQRLKGVASSLEAGYELATIPHFGIEGGTGRDGNHLLEEFDPLELDRYSELNILIRSLNEVVVDLEAISEQTAEIQSEWYRAVERQRKVLTEVQGAIQAIQMAPFSTLANRLYRTVRESARATHKSVRLLIEGGDLEMDTHVWDVLADPLMHMLRNAVDHGIESPQARLDSGKPEQAIIRIRCSRRGSNFILSLSDDGAGLDYDAIRARAIKLYPDLAVENLTESELGALIFKQGFSVRNQVTDISGRGVGMDVVRNGVEQLNGSIDVKSRPGQGVNFILTIPIVVAQLPALLVRFGDRKYALPMRDINRVLRVGIEETRTATIDVDGNEVPLLYPVSIFNPAADAAPETGDSRLGILLDVNEKRCVLLVDGIVGRQEVVFKNLGAPLDTIPFVAGATIMGDGGIVPIVHTDDLLEISDIPQEVQDAERVEEQSRAERPLTILFADDSISIRKVLGKFISFHGWQPVAAHDGVDGLEKIREHKPDIIILDIEMPRMNGFEVLQSLQYQPEYKDIPVLMLTSRSADKYREKARALGADGFVTKPFNDEDLSALITALAARKNNQDITAQ
jgi:chemosensory pili system protein ChpA (sensor histidine kinase/response regulator)